MNLLTQVCNDFNENVKIKNKGENIPIDVTQCDELKALKAEDTKSKCLTGVEIALFIKKDDPFVEYYSVTSGAIKL